MQTFNVKISFIMHDMKSRFRNEVQSILGLNLGFLFGSACWTFSIFIFLNSFSSFFLFLLELYFYFL